MFPAKLRIILPVVLSLFCFLNVSAQLSPRAFTERFAARSMETIHGAQMTYMAVSGTRSFGTLADLRSQGLIDAALAEGEKYGYVLSIHVTPGTQNSPARFTATAVPRLYRKNGIRSFYVDESGIVRGADRHGAVAEASDPEVEICPLYGNEPCAIRIMRWLHGAEMAYASMYGNNNYGTLAALGSVQMITPNMAGGVYGGYVYSVEKIDRIPFQNAATFRIFAVPQVYRSTGTRSFFIATDGVIRGADKNGKPADENDPPLEP